LKDILVAAYLTVTSLPLLVPMNIQHPEIGSYADRSQIIVTLNEQRVTVPV
jgi:hypothetical protein